MASFVEEIISSWRILIFFFQLLCIQTYKNEFELFKTYNKSCFVVENTRASLTSLKTYIQRGFILEIIILYFLWKALLVIAWLVYPLCSGESICLPIFY